MDLNFNIIIDILLIILIIVSSFMIYGYNALIQRRNDVEKSESDIQIYLEKRFDLVPNLVEVVKGYTKHEQKAIEDVTKARESYGGGKFNVTDIDAADKSISRFVAITENYPDLKANTEYMNLSQKLSKIEDEIGHVRRVYNRTATDYNTKVQTVPFSLVAKIFNFKKKDLFKVKSEEEREPVKVKL